MEPPELHVFDDARSLGTELGQALGVDCSPVEVHRFPDGESRVRVQPSGGRTGSGRAVLLRSLDHPNERLLEVLFAADALRRAGVGELVLVAPYLGYMRQDTAFRDGEAVSQQVIGALLGDAFDRVLTVEAHLHRTARLCDAIPCDARSLSSAPLIAEWCRARAADAASAFDVIVGPDAESEPWVRATAERAGLPFRICRKERSGDREVVVRVPAAPEGARRALLIDDIASSGVTLEAATRGLREQGLAAVEAVVVHALLDAEAPTRLQAAGLDALHSTDTVPHASNAIATAPLLAGVLSGLGPAAPKER